MNTLRRACIGLASIVGSVAPGARAQEAGYALVETESFRLRAGGEIGLQYVVQHNAFWKLSDTFAAGAPFDDAPAWPEGYIEPYLSFEADVQEATLLYGRLSVLASISGDTDVFAQERSGRIGIEDAFVGVRTGTDAGWVVDVSVGPQPYKLGTGMLVSDGASDGFERGAIIFGPRAAWQNAAILRASAGGARFEAFYLDAQELASSDSGTRLAGAAWVQELAPGISLGVGGGNVVQSDAPWVQAAPGGSGAPTILFGGRDGLSFLTAWGSFAANERLTFSADLAYEWNSSSDMTAWAGRGRVEYAFPDLPLLPRVGYAFQAFSGDDPDTPELERFDPLLYDGSPAGWGSGANASLVFLNTNIAAHQLYTALMVSPQDFLTFRYYHVRALHLRSPLQFGQATRLDVNGTPTVLTGVTNAHLADDVYAEYTRILTPNTFLTAGFAASFPGAGTRDLRGGSRDVWLGGYVNIVWRL